MLFHLKGTTKTLRETAVPFERNDRKYPTKVLFLWKGTTKTLCETVVPFKRNNRSVVSVERNSNAKKTQNFYYFSFIKKLNSNEIKKY